MAWSRPQCLLMQLSPFTHTSFRAFPLQPCMSFHSCAITGGCDVLWSRFAQASPFASRLAKLIHRIEFTCVWDCSFVSGCFPPRLTTTQFPLTSPPFTGSVEFRFSLTGLYVVMITLARCVSHRTEYSNAFVNTKPFRSFDPSTSSGCCRLKVKACAVRDAPRYPSGNSFAQTFDSTIETQKTNICCLCLVSLSGFLL